MSGDIRIYDHIWNGSISVVLASRDGILFIAYVGPALCGPNEDDLALDASLLSRGVVGGGLDTEVVPALIPLPSQGWMGLPGLEVLRNGDRLPLDLRIVPLEWEGPFNESMCVLHDALHNITVEVSVAVTDAEVVVIDASVTQLGDDDIVINQAHLNIPVGSHAGEVLTLGGRHAMEAVQQRTPWGRSKILLENRTGRTSHEQLGVVFVGTPGFTEQTGEVWGAHLAWSGNFRMCCDGVTETLRTIQVGELLTTGEVALNKDDSYQFPSLVLSHSQFGLNTVSQNFHAHIRQLQGDISRPVVLNTWEAVYFKHDLDTLKDLATVAADVGVERFVLDDGWFHARRDDTAGLGDWWVDNTVWPGGLEPLISHVTSLGVEFGLWFEPEMVNPNSDLFRAHPEWALNGTLPSPILGRNQLVLDLSRSDVRDYLFEKIHALLSEYDISYVKWDHNRPLVGGASHQQTHGFYSLLQRLTEAHPHVQFESCASGGGRIDVGVAKYVKRFWASDSIDALDRLEIQKGLTTFIPPEMLGSHIGSPVCHTTGRKHALSFRVSTALFGWLGVEWNLLTLTEKERNGLRSAISFYKTHRHMLHTGNFFRVDHPDDTVDIRGVMSWAAQEGLFSVSRLRSGPSNHSAPLRLPIDGSDHYNVSIINLGTPRWALHRQLPQWIQDGGIIATGTTLANIGLPMPSLLPESSFLIHVKAVNEQ